MSEEWRDISTAPKNGKPVELRCFPANQPEEVIRVKWGKWRWANGCWEEGWCSATAGWIIWRGYNPQAWRPAPPEQEQTT